MRISGRRSKEYWENVQERLNGKSFVQSMSSAHQESHLPPLCLMWPHPRHTDTIILRPLIFLSTVFVYNFAWGCFLILWPLNTLGSAGGGGSMKILLGNEGGGRWSFLQSTEQPPLTGLWNWLLFKMQLKKLNLKYLWTRIYETFSISGVKYILRLFSGRRCLGSLCISGVCLGLVLVQKALPVPWYKHNCVIYRLNLSCDNINIEWNC